MSRPLRAFVIIVFLLVAAGGACGQSAVASATMTVRVSGAVVVSAAEARALSDRAHVSTANVDATTVVVSISGSGDGEARVNLPLRLRSNAGYSLRASLISPGELFVRLSVAGVRATGGLVRANALEGISLAGAPGDERGESAHFLTAQNRPPQFDVLSGPPVSKAGTFSSPDNAIEIVLSVEVRPPPAAQSWSTRLTISAAPNPHAGR